MESSIDELNRRFEHGCEDVVGGELEIKNKFARLEDEKYVCKVGDDTVVLKNRKAKLITPNAYSDITDVSWITNEPKLSNMAIVGSKGSFYENKIEVRR